MRQIREEVEKGNEPVLSRAADIITSDGFQTFEAIQLLVGFLLSALFLLELLSTIFRWWCSFYKRLAEVLNFLTASSSAWADMRLKRAATRKINKLLLNAHRLHQPNELFTGLSLGIGVSNVSKDQAMHNYFFEEERTEPAGGIVWTWWKIFDGSLFDTEGIWINTRLLITQVAQVILMCVVSFILLTTVEDIADQSEEARDELGPNVPDWVRDFVPTRRKYAKIALITSKLMDHTLSSLKPLLQNATQKWFTEPCIPLRSRP